MNLASIQQGIKKLQWFEYLKVVFLEILNAELCRVFANQVTYGEDRILYLIQCIEEKTKHNNICYNNLLSKAICKKWNDRFVHHCLKRGAKFTPKDVWTVLKWPHDSRKQNLLKSIVSQDGAMDIQNDKGELLLDFLLEQGWFKDALTLLEFKIDTSGIDIVKTMESVKKYDAPIIEILNGIIANKKQPSDLLKQELTSALKYAFINNKYDVAAMLIDHGADISSCVEKSTTAVHVATKIALHVNGMYKLYVAMCTYDVRTYIL